MTTPAKRYNAFGLDLRRRYGCTVYKLTIDAGFTCPNLDGVISRGGCTFCNNVGFSPATRRPRRSIRDQLIEGMKFKRRRYGAEKFIAYFQAFTNTHAPVNELAATYDEAWQFEDVVGMAVGTRPDCVDAAKLDLIAGYANRGEIWIEYGLQSAHDATLRRINRGHDYASFVEAVRLTAGLPIKICVHTILGLPGETPAMMLETHARVASLPIDAIKIHPLHILPETVMERQYRAGKLTVLSRHEWIDTLCDVLEILPARMLIQRLHADAPPGILVAPTWCGNKAAALNAVDRELERRNSRQGCRYPWTEVASEQIPA